MAEAKKTTKGEITIDPFSVVVDDDALRQQRELLMRCSLEEIPGISVYGLLGQLAPRRAVSAPEIEQASADSIGK
jgi:hypothetical protein